MGRLAGKVAIVTGGARGMGEATSRLFAAEGARVVIADVLDREGEALAGAIGSAALFRHHDVTDEASWEAVTADAVRQFGGVDVLVNNAGVLLFKALTETSKAEFERVIGVNLVGTFLGMKIVAPRMIERGKGSIINISSTAGISGQNGTVAYAASKFGVRGMTKIAALELGHRGVRVNSIHPGGINTVMGVAPGHAAGDHRSVLQGGAAAAHRPAGRGCQRVALSRERRVLVCLWRRDPRRRRHARGHVLPEPAGRPGFLTADRV